MSHVIAPAEVIRQPGDLGPALTFSADGAGTVFSNEFENQACSGIKVVINITAITGTSPTLTVTLQGVDAASAAVYTILASAALNATGTTVLTVFPGAPVTANVSANDELPPKFQVKAVIGGTTPAVTATVGLEALA